MIRKKASYGASKHTESSGWSAGRVATVFAIVVGLWFLSGIIFPPDISEDEQENTVERQPFKVRVMTVQEAPSFRYVVTNGVTEANRVVDLLSEVDGKVAALKVSEGAYIKKGAAIVKLEVQDRAARLAQAQALVKQKQIEYNAAKKLNEQGLAANSTLAQRRAALEEAKAQRVNAGLVLKRSTIDAPFNGVVDKIYVEEGELVSTRKDPLVRMVDASPLVVRAQVPEFDIAGVKVGQSAEVEIADGRTQNGTVRFVGALAEDATRTFRVEVELSNENRELPAGVTATVKIPVEQVMAHLVPTASLALGKDSEVGIKGVRPDNSVIFYPVDILRDTGKGLWVKGLPAQATIITLGGGFVADGEKVTPVSSDVSAAQLDNAPVSTIDAMSPAKAMDAGTAAPVDADAGVDTHVEE